MYNTYMCTTHKQYKCFYCNIHSPNATYHAGCEQPVMDLSTVVTHTVHTQIPYLQRLLLSTQVYSYIAWHQYLAVF